MRKLIGLSALMTSLFVLMMLPSTSTAQPQAFCHFDLSASPSSIPEGGSVSVRVQSATVGSAVDVVTEDDSAKAPSDYQATRKTMEFSSPGEKSFSLPTTDDAESEGEESFKIHLTNYKGCEGAAMVRSLAIVKIQPSDAQSSSPIKETSAGGSQNSTRSTPAAPVAPGSTADVAGAGNESASDSTSPPITKSLTVIPKRQAGANQSEQGQFAPLFAVLFAVLVAAGIVTRLWYLRKASR